MRSGLPLPSNVCWSRLQRTGCLFALTMVLLPAVRVEAGASCGHYVRRMGAGFKPAPAATEKLAPQSAAAGLPSAKRAAALPAWSSEPTLTATPCHCTGPECQGMPTAPAPLTPALPTAQSDQEWAVVLSNLPEFANVPGPWDRGMFSVRPLAGYRTLPDRPPNG